MDNADSLLAQLRHRAEHAAEEPFLRVGGRQYTVAEFWANVATTALGLGELGIGAGDRVVIMADNRVETIWAWLAVNALGAIDVPLNTAARGAFLAYLFADAEPRAVIGTADYLAILAETIRAHPEYAICIGDGTVSFGVGTRFLSFDQLRARGATSTAELPQTSAADTATIMYTSGTTGPPKGVMLPRRYYPYSGAALAKAMGVQRREVIYNVQPLYHIDARVFLAAALASEAVFVLGTRFSVRRFWADVREHKVNIFCTVGTMMLLLAKQDRRDDDADQPARLAVCSSTPPDLLVDFQQRFGVEVLESYGLTEAVLLTHSVPGRTQPARVGTAVDDFDVCLVDDNDVPAERGAIGELCFRPKHPFTCMQGYWGKPAETVRAWRNLWFHTGDFLRQHPGGQFEYIGRKKDAIRRRGENISAWEVETAVAAHPDVLEVAAIGVPSELGEEDVAVLIVRRPGSNADPRSICDFAGQNLPAYAVPRYVEFIDKFPKTPSERIAKSEVRARGVTDAAWDAEEAARAVDR